MSRLTCTPVRSVEPAPTTGYTEIVEVQVPARFYWVGDAFDGIEFGPFDRELHDWESQMIDRCLEAVRPAIGRVEIDQPPARARCHDCDVEEGQRHIPGCDMEVCSACGGQRLACECPETEPRIPYVQVPVLCALCGQRWPEFFSVPDDEWDRYVVPLLQGEVLCRECYDEQVSMFPNGWRHPCGTPES